MKLEAMSAELQRRYLEINDIKDAFIWNDDGAWNVYLGSSADACGFRESTHRTKKEAAQEAARLNQHIQALLAS